MRAIANSLPSISHRLGITRAELMRCIRLLDLEASYFPGGQVRLPDEEVRQLTGGVPLGRLVPISRVAKFYSVLPETVRAWCERGSVQYVRFGAGHYLIDTASLKGWPNEKPEPPRWEDQRECVYFAQDSVGLLVKIGYTSSLVSERIADIARGIPYKCELKCLLSMRGPRLLERHIHAEFAGGREKGEWFRATKELSDFIVRHGGNAPALDGRVRV